MQNNACTAKGVEDSSGGGCWGGKIDEDLGKFWREHADESVARRASVIAFSIGGNILNGKRDGVKVVIANNFVAGAYRLGVRGAIRGEAVVDDSGGGECGGSVWDEANRAALATEKMFLLEGELPSRGL